MQRDGRVPCAGRCSKNSDHRCASAPFADEDLARLLPPDVFQKYIESRTEIREKQLVARYEAKLKEPLSMVASEINKDGYVAWQIQNIRCDLEDLLNIKCPRESCRQPMAKFHCSLKTATAGGVRYHLELMHGIDFRHNCMALQCPHGCGCGFCGWCLKDCGNMAVVHDPNNEQHKHIRMCNRRPPGADVFFATRKQFESVHSKQKSAELKTYLDAFFSSRGFTDIVAISPEFKSRERFLLEIFKEV